jgi:nitroreductase
VKKMPEAPEVLDFLARRQSLPAKLMTPPVPDEAAIGRILQLAVRVPDHGKLTPWRFAVLAPAAAARIGDLAAARAAETGADPAKGRGVYDRGLAAIVVIGRPVPSDKVPPVEQMLSAGALCQNILIAATAMGWGANWLSGWPAHDPVFCARAFGTTGAEWVAGIIHMGRLAEVPADRPRPDAAALTTWIRA